MRTKLLILPILLLFISCTKQEDVSVEKHIEGQPVHEFQIDFDTVWRDDTTILF